MAGVTDSIDLDAVLRPDVIVLLGGTKYRLPGDPPTELMLSIGMLLEHLDKFGDDEDVETERLLELREELGLRIEDLFRIRNPKLAEGEIQLTDGQIIELVRRLMEHYNAPLEEMREEADARSRPTTAPRRKSSARSRPKSSSRKPASGSSTSSSS